MRDPDQVYFYKSALEKSTIDFTSISPYPLILVNIGTGVSIVRVESATEFKRISGSGIGGGTYWV